MAPRARPPVDLTIRIPGLERTTVKDLSASGVCCETSSALPLLSHVHVVLVLPTLQGLREVPCDGAVVRSARKAGPKNSAFETAIFFTAIDAADRSAIATYADTLRRQGATA